MNTANIKVRPQPRADQSRKATRTKSNDAAEAKGNVNASKVEPTTAPDLQNEVRDARNDIIDAANKPAEQAKLFEALDGEQMQTRQLEEFQQLEETLQSVKQNPKATPSIQSAPTASAAEIKSGKAPATALPKGVDAVYVPSKNAIIVREGLTGKELKAAIKEEMGEWLGTQAEKSGVKVAPGDVGARVAKAESRQTLSAEDFKSKSSDTTQVLLNGKLVKARAKTTSPGTQGSSQSAPLRSRGATSQIVFSSSDQLEVQFQAKNGKWQTLDKKSREVPDANDQVPELSRAEVLNTQGLTAKTKFRVLLTHESDGSSQVVATNDLSVKGAKSTFEVKKDSDGTQRIFFNSFGDGKIVGSPTWLKADKQSDVSITLRPKLAPKPKPKPTKTTVAAPVVATPPAPKVTNIRSQVYIPAAKGPVTLEALNAETGKWVPLAKQAKGGKDVHILVDIPTTGKDLPKLRVRTPGKSFENDKAGQARVQSKDGLQVIGFETTPTVDAKGNVKGQFDDVVVTVGTKKLLPKPVAPKPAAPKPEAIAIPVAKPGTKPSSGVAVVADTRQPSTLSVWQFGDQLSGMDRPTAAVALSMAINKPTFNQKDINALVKQGVLTKGTDGKYKVDLSKLSIGQKTAILTGIGKLTDPKTPSYGTPMFTAQQKPAWQKRVLYVLGARQAPFKTAVEGNYRTKGETYSQALSTALRDGFIQFGANKLKLTKSEKLEPQPFGLLRANEFKPAFMTIKTDLHERSGWHTDDTSLSYFDETAERYVPIITRKGKWNREIGGIAKENQTVVVPLQNGKPPELRFKNTTIGNVWTLALPVRDARTGTYSYKFENSNTHHNKLVNEAATIAISTGAVAAAGATAAGMPIAAAVVGVGGLTIAALTKAFNSRGEAKVTATKGGKIEWFDGGNWDNIFDKTTDDRKDYTVDFKIYYAETPEPELKRNVNVVEIPTIASLKAQLAQSGGPIPPGRVGDELAIAGFSYEPSNSAITENDAGLILAGMNNGKPLDAASLAGFVESGNIRLRRDGTWSLSPLAMTGKQRADVVRYVLSTRDLTTAQKEGLIKRMTGKTLGEVSAHIDKFVGNGDGNLSSTEAEGPLANYIFGQPIDPTTYLFGLQTPAPTRERPVSAPTLEELNKKPKALTEPVKPGIEGVHTDFTKNGRIRTANNLKVATNWDVDHKGRDVKSLLTQLSTMIRSAANKKFQAEFNGALRSPAVQAFMKAEAAGTPLPTPKPGELTKAQVNDDSVVGFGSTFHALVYDNYLDIGLKDFANPGLFKSIGVALAKRGYKMRGKVGRVFEQMARAEQKRDAYEADADAAFDLLGRIPRGPSEQRNQLVRRYRRSINFAQSARDVLSELGTTNFGLSIRTFVPIYDFKTKRFNKGIVDPGTGFSKGNFEKLDYTMLARLGVVEAAGNPKAILGFDQAGLEVSADFTGGTVNAVTVNGELEAGLIGDFWQMLKELGHGAEAAGKLAKRMFDAVKNARGSAEQRVRSAETVLSPEDRARLNADRKDGPWWRRSAQILNGQLRMTWDLNARKSPLLTQAQKTTSRPDYIRIQGLMANAKIGLMGVGAGHSYLTLSNDVAFVNGGSYSWTASAAGRVAANGACATIPEPPLPAPKPEAR